MKQSNTISTCPHIITNTHTTTTKRAKKKGGKKEETLRSNYAKVHFVNQETNCTTHYPKGPKKKWNRLDDKTFHVISSTQSCNKVLPNPCNKCKHSQILRAYVWLLAVFVLFFLIIYSLVPASRFRCLLLFECVAWILEVIKNILVNYKYILA